MFFFFAFFFLANFVLKAAFACVLLRHALEAPLGAAVARAGMQDWTCFPLFIPDDLWMTLRGPAATPR